MTVSTILNSVSNLFRNLALALIAVLALLVGARQPVLALPVNGAYTDDSRCDAIPNQSLPHEIGETTAFPIDERISVVVSAAGSYACVGDDGVANDFVVQMTNLSSYSYTDLFFVADATIMVGNADGLVIDLVNSPGVVTDAFRIDGTVTFGANDNLFNESGVVNEIFEPGETWRFLVTNVVFPASVPPTLIFDSAGAFSGGSLGTPPSTASILGTQVVPEPTTALLLGFGLAVLGLRRRLGA
jgi:hypothetical protein